MAAKKHVALTITAMLSACASNQNFLIDPDVVQLRPSSSESNAAELGLNLGASYYAAAQYMTNQGWELRQGCEVLPTRKGSCTADFRKQNQVAWLIVTVEKFEPIISAISMGECLECER